jgi:hypothetical protein
MRQLAADLWDVEVPLRAFGYEVGRRMTVVRLGDGGLFLHSPAPLTAQLRATLDDLGPVRFIVAPNLVHGHRFMEQYRAAYPSAELVGGPGVDARRRDLTFDGLLGGVPDPRWRDDLDQAVFLGSYVPEVLFLHRSSRTLIVGDLVIAVSRGSARSRGARIAWTLEGVYGRAAMPRSYRLVTRNRRAARRSVERILSWDFDRLVLGHGDVIERGGRAAFERAMAWLV